MDNLRFEYTLRLLRWLATQEEEISEELDLPFHKIKAISVRAGAPDSL